MSFDHNLDEEIYEDIPIDGPGQMTVDASLFRSPPVGFRSRIDESNPHRLAVSVPDPGCSRSDG